MADPVVIAIDTPLWDRRRGLVVYTGWQNASINPDSVGPFPTKWAELPFVSNKARLWATHSFNGWWQSPLSSNSIGPFPSKIFELPVRGRAPPLQEWRQSPLSADSIGPFTKSFDLPVRGRPPLFQKWEQTPLSSDSIGPFPSKVFDLPVRGRLQPIRDFQLSPLSSTFSAPIQMGGVWYDNPLARQFLKNSFDGFFQYPLPLDNVAAFGRYSFDLPLVARSRGKDYNGQQSVALFTIATLGPLPSSIYLDLPPDSKMSTMKRQLLFGGFYIPPLSSNAAAGTIQQYLPLLGVGS
jgi:hypothetical protein